MDEVVSRVELVSVVMRQLIVLHERRVNFHHLVHLYDTLIRSMMMKTTNSISCESTTCTSSLGLISSFECSHLLNSDWNSIVLSWLNES